MVYYPPIIQSILDPAGSLLRVQNAALGGPGIQLRGVPQTPQQIAQIPRAVMPEPPRTPSLLERLFPTPAEYSGLLSPEAVSSARKNQLLQLGIGLLANSGPRVRGTPGSGFGDRLGAALGQMPNWNDVLGGLVQQRMALMKLSQPDVATADAGDRVLFYDKNTGQPVGYAPKGAVPTSKDTTTQDYATRANALRGQYLTQTTNERAVAQAYQSVLAADKSPAGDIALVFGFMKMVDPTSVVREGEFATAQNAGSVPERVRAMYNRALNGERLTDTIRADFIQQATNRANRSRQSLQKVIQDYHRRAQRIGVDPADAAYDYFLGAEPTNPRRAPPQAGGALPPLHFP